MEGKGQKTTKQYDTKILVLNKILIVRNRVTLKF